MNYFILANTYLILFYGFYRLLLANETFFQLNRAYLIITTLLSFILPLIQLTWLQEMFSSPAVIAARSSLDAVTINTGPMLTTSAASRSPNFPIWLYFYIAGCLIQIFFFIWRVLSINKRLKTDRTGDAYSFMNQVKVDETKAGSELVIDHERIHVKQKHTFDLLFFEVVKIFNWFNPIVYCFSKSIKLIHEYIADAAVNKDPAHKIAYAELLISNTFSTSSSVLSNSFLNQSLIRSRIVMLFRNQSKRSALFKYLLAMPLFVAMLVFSSAKVSDSAESLTVLSVKPQELNTFYKLIVRNVRYMQGAKEEDAEGFVDIAFDHHNNQLTTKVLNTIGYQEEKEVLRVLQLAEVKAEMPEGKYILRIKFKILNGENDDVMEHKNDPVPKLDGYHHLEDLVIVGYERSDGRAGTLKNEQRKQDKDYIAMNVNANALSHNVNVNIKQRKRTLDGGVVDYDIMEIPPRFPGGLKAFYKWIGQHYNYPIEAKERGISGTLHISFIVEKDGSLENIQILRDLGYGTGEAAIELLKGSPKWKPGIFGGEPVKVSYALPIKLNLTKPTSKG